MTPNTSLKNLISLGNCSRQDFTIHFDDTQEHHSLPISIINGKEKGKVFTLVAGIHGYEYPPILALQKILAEIDPNILKGTLIVLPIANIGAFYQRSIRINRDDEKNLNYIFPGKENGSISERLAHYITTQIIPYSDVFLDIHGGDANEDLIPFSCYYEDYRYPQNTQLAKALCQVSGLPYLVSYPYTISDDEPALYAFKQAVQMGKVALSLEVGKLGNANETDTLLLENAIYNMLIAQNMLSGEIKNNKEEPIYLTQQTYIRVPHRGIFHSKLLSGDHIEKGQCLGYITDVFGNKLEDIISPTDGVILYKIGTPPVNIGETMFCIAR